MKLQWIHFFYSFAKAYYSEKLQGEDFRDLKVLIKGNTTISFGNRKHKVYRVEVSYSFYKNNKVISVNSRAWNWDLKERKCYCYLDEFLVQEPLIERKFLTSVVYLDVTNESFAQNGFMILDADK